jgi:hypothetical protein
LEIRAEGPRGGSRKAALFSVTKKHAAGEIEARITIKEFATPTIIDMQFLATADIELNQKTLKFQPVGWSETMMGALAECMRNLRKFDFEICEELPAPPKD